MVIILALIKFTNYKSETDEETNKWNKFLMVEASWPVRLPVWSKQDERVTMTIGVDLESKEGML